MGECHHVFLEVVKVEPASFDRLRTTPPFRKGRPQEIRAATRPRRSLSHKLLVQSRGRLGAVEQRQVRVDETVELIARSDKLPGAGGVVSHVENDSGVGLAVVELVQGREPGPRLPAPGGAAPVDVVDDGLDEQTQPLGLSRSHLVVPHTVARGLRGIGVDAVVGERLAVAATVQESIAGRVRA